MSTRLASGFIIALGIAASVFAQQVPQGTSGSVMDPGAAQKKRLDTVATLEAIVRKAGQEHLSDLEMGRAYWHLGISYVDAGEIGRAESVLNHSAVLFRQSDTKGGELAEALDSLAILHGATGKLPAATKEELEALELRQKLGDRVLIARSWETMAALMLKQKKFDQAKVFAQKAADGLEENNDATFNDKLAAKFSLGMALCGQKDYVTAVLVLQKAAADARSTLSPQSVPAGVGNVLLGYAYWKAGDISNARAEMKSGINILNAQLNLGSPSYLPLLRTYAKFLHETRNVAEATEVDQRIHQAESLVSVGQLQSGPEVFGFTGLH